MFNMELHNIMSGPGELEPTPDYSLGRYLIEKFEKHGNRTAQVDAVTGRTTTFTSILNDSKNVAQGLSRRGVKSGDVVSILSGNSLEFCLPALASSYVGATCAPLNPAYTPRELLHAMNISKPRIIFCASSTVGNLEKIANQVPYLKDIVVFEDNVSHKHIPFTDFLREDSRRLRIADVEPNSHVAAIMCSSGTTGLPKGVMLTHKNVIVAIGHLRDPRFGNLKPSDVHLGLLPMFHAYAYIVQLSILALGVKSVILPRFEEQLFLSSLQNYKITVTMLVPPLLVFLAKHPLVDRYDLSSLTDIWCGAAPLSEEIQTQVTKRINVKLIRQGYGMTETTLAVLMTPPNKNKYGSSGILVPNTKCKVVDLVTDNLLGPNQEGELCFKGPLIMKGYCSDVGATASMTDQDGYLRTGDIGYYDTDGFFFVVDRLKELIKYKGYQVPPAELEAVLLSHPAIKDAGVIGIPDEIAGELPLAIVVRQPGTNITADEVIQYVAGQVSPQKRLHGGVKFVDSIPKSASGKILRRLLRDAANIKSKL